MRYYWGFHNIVLHDTEVQSGKRDRELVFKDMPFDKRMRNDDVAYLFWGDNYLYGAGSLQIGEPYLHSDGRMRCDVTVYPALIRSQIASYPDIKANLPDSRQSSELSYFTAGQALYLYNLCGRPPVPAPDPQAGIPGGWEAVDQNEDFEGNQGTIVKIRRKSDGAFGALKRLHPDRSSTLNRLRMQREVTALRAMAGRGTPKVLEANETSWDNRAVPLYLVMEWVDGRKLEDCVQGRPLAIDDAVAVVRALLDTVDVAQGLGIDHRDLKPDNIIAADGEVGRPIIVDFGMAWSKPSEEEEKKLATGAGVELGNRFLRLPEYAPGHHRWDERSDLTMIVGILFYLVAGKMPRVLVDAQGQMPQQRADLPKVISGDERWPLLERLFHVGFQTPLDRRFQSSSQLRGYLDRLTVIDDKGEELLKAATARVNEFFASDRYKLPQEAKLRIRQAIEVLESELKSRCASAGFLMNGVQWQVGEDRGVAYCNCSWHIYKEHPPLLKAEFDHEVRFEDNTYKARHRVEGSDWLNYYSGPGVDHDSFEAALKKEAIKVLIELMQLYSKRVAEWIR